MRALLALPRWAYIAAALAALIGGGLVLHRCTVDDAAEIAREAGAREAVNRGHETTITQIGDANAAGNQIRDDRGSARYCECLRSATADTAGNCVRFRPHQPVPGGPDDPAAYCTGGGR